MRKDLYDWLEVKALKENIKSDQRIILVCTSCILSWFFLILVSYQLNNYRAMVVLSVIGLLLCISLGGFIYCSVMNIISDKKKIKELTF